MCRVQSGVAAPAGRPVDGGLRRRHAEVSGGGKGVAGTRSSCAQIFLHGGGTIFQISGLKINYFFLFNFPLPFILQHNSGYHLG